MGKNINHHSVEKYKFTKKIPIISQIHKYYVIGGSDSLTQDFFTKKYGGKAKNLTIGSSILDSIVKVSFFEGAGFSLDEIVNTYSHAESKVGFIAGTLISAIALIYNGKRIRDAAKDIPSPAINTLNLTLNYISGIQKNPRLCSTLSFIANSQGYELNSPLPSPKETETYNQNTANLLYDHKAQKNHGTKNTITKFYKHI